MAFRPNYRRDRLERDRAVRARTDEKQKKRDEKSAKRKAERTEVEGPPDEQAQHVGGPPTEEPTNQPLAERLLPATDRIPKPIASRGRSIDFMRLILLNGVAL